MAPADMRQKKNKPAIAQSSSQEAEPHSSQGSSVSGDSWSTQATRGSPVKPPHSAPSKKSKQQVAKKAKRLKKRACGEHSWKPPSKRASSGSKSAAERTPVWEGCPPDVGWGWRMPAELLHQVFGLLVDDVGSAVPALHRVARVCQLWRDAAFAPHLWRAVDLSRTRKKYRTATHLRWLLENRLQGVRRLGLGGWPCPKVVNCGTLSEVCAACPELAHLDLSSLRLKPEMLLTVAQHAPRLAGLNLSLVNMSTIAQTLRQLTAQMGGRLTSLSLCNTTHTRLSNVVTLLMEQCPALEELDLSNIDTLRAPVPVAIPRLQEGCPRLRVLCWSNTNITLFCDQQGPLPGLPNLEELSAAVLRDSGFQGISDSDVVALLSGSPRLRLLDLRGCALTTGTSLSALPATSVQYLYLTGCSELDFTGLAGALCRWHRSLLELDLSYSGPQHTLDAALLAFSSADLPAEEEAGQLMRSALGADVVEAAGGGAEGPPLRELSLQAAPVSLSAVRCVLAACQRLRRLDLTNIRELPRGMKLVYSDIILENLKNGIDSIVRRSVEGSRHPRRV